MEPDDAGRSPADVVAFMSVFLWGSQPNPGHFPTRPSVYAGTVQSRTALIDGAIRVGS